jgi:hypothetical protein
VGASHHEFGGRQLAQTLGSFEDPLFHREDAACMGAACRAANSSGVVFAPLPANGDLDKFRHETPENSATAQDATLFETERERAGPSCVQVILTYRGW